MDRKIKLFNDIVTSIDNIERFLGSINLFEEYAVDLKTKSAIERQLGIVGEAIKRIKK
ncbi:MAG: HepT-like ribonuclease domain-containing protein [Mucilaginibacter sp.]